MKKIQYLAVCAAALLTLTTACKKESGERADVTFEVVIAKEAAKADDGTKVYLDNALYPNWNSNDPIRVNDGDGAVTPYEGDETRGTFTANITEPSDHDYYAVFPANAAKRIGSNGIVLEEYDLHSEQKVCLPRVQPYETYDDNGTTKQKINAPMFAYNPEQPILQFHNLCGVMAITITNDKAWDMVLDSIQVEATTYKLCGVMDIYRPTFENPSIKATHEIIDSFNVDARQYHTVSLGGIDKYLHSTRLETSDEDNSITLYVYLPTIESNSDNLFYIRVFSHPAWRANTTDVAPYDNIDNEVHISYEKRQTNSSNAYVTRNSIIPIDLSLESCKPTFTSMKPFSTSANGDGSPVSISRGNAQYYIKTYDPSQSDCHTIGHLYSPTDYTGTGYWGFSPRQWAFLMTTELHHDNYHNDMWIEYFTWDSGLKPTHHYHTGQTGSATNVQFVDWEGDWGTNFTNVTTNSTWRAFTQSEINYLLKERTTRGTIRDNFAWVTLTDAVPVSNTLHGNSLFGIIILPDHFEDPGRADELTLQALGLGNNYTFKCYDHVESWSGDNGRGDVATRYRNDNEMTTAQFEYFEAKGCILIPCIGVLDGLGYENDEWTENQPEGAFWTSTYHSLNDAYILMISADTPSGATNAGRADCRTASDAECYRHLNVRLVRPYVAGGNTYKYDPFQ